MSSTRLPAKQDALISAAWRRRLSATACALVLLAGASSPPVAAETVADMRTTRAYDIPSQPLANALRAFGRQSGLQVSLAAEAARGMRSTDVVGTLTMDAALAQMLAGTGLAHRIENGVVVVGSAIPASAGTPAASENSTVLGKINVTGQRRSARLNVVTIGADDLAARNPSDIAGVFRDQADISVGSSIPTSQKVFVNGLEETTLAVTIDGSRQNNRVFHHNATNLIDPSLLSRVTVDAGIAPADAGPAALAGSIAYETRHVSDLLSEDGFGGLVSQSYATNSRAFTTGLGGWALQDGVEFLGFLNLGKGDNYTAGSGQEVRGTETNLLSGLGKFAYEAESGERFEISHERVRDDAERPFRANASAVTTGRSWEPRYRNYTLDRDNTVFTYTDTMPEGWWDPTIRLAYSHSAVETPIYFNDGSGNPASYSGQGESGSLNGQVQNRFALDSGDLVVGVDFYSDRIALDTARNAEDAEEKARNLGFYTQARLEPTDRMRLSFGGRGDAQWFQATTGQTWRHAGVSGNASVEYDLTNMLTAKLGASHVWAGIPLAEAFIMNPGWTYGASGPQTTSANNLLAGLRFEHEGFSAEASVFRSRIHDARVAKFAVGEANRNYDVETRGFELGAGYDWIDGFLKVGYAHVDVEIDGKPADSDTGNYLATPVGDIIILSAGHRFEAWGLTIGGDVEIAPEYRSGAATYASYEVVNLYGEWKPEALPHMTFRAEVQNLLNETYASRATYGQEFGNVTPLYEPGRSLLLSVKATF
jgi:hemoglobin/transferrin/lactoferrin receptor protein